MVYIYLFWPRLGRHLNLRNFKRNGFGFDLNMLNGIAFWIWKFLDHSFNICVYVTIDWKVVLLFFIIPNLRWISSFYLHSAIYFANWQNLKQKMVFLWLWKFLMNGTLTFENLKVWTPIIILLTVGWLNKRYFFFKFWTSKAWCSLQNWEILRKMASDFRLNILDSLAVCLNLICRNVNIDSELDTFFFLIPSFRRISSFYPQLEIYIQICKMLKKKWCHFLSSVF